MSAKTGVAEIKLRSFRQPFQFIIGIWPEQIDNAEAFEKPQPFFRGRLGDFRRVSQCFVIQLFRNKSRTSGQKFLKPKGIRHTANFRNVAHQIGIDIGVVIFLPLLGIGMEYLGHAAAPDMSKHIDHIIFRNF
ncbi:hypothetical protein SDC9_143577 [bioreactor metagenome]|uniref:Uncharacterized protein n=1 Tax=bioreactor metagenome TaxID=1076179 RepID=A0A645E3P4_9ZZZZ